MDRRQRRRFDLYWNARSVETVMYRNGIHSRNELSKHIGVSSETVCRVFDEQWEGRATKNVLAQMCAIFRVPLDYLVIVGPTDVQPPRRLSARGVSK